MCVLGTYSASKGPKIKQIRGALQILGQKTKWPILIGVHCNEMKSVLCAHSKTEVDMIDGLYNK